MEKVNLYKTKPTDILVLRDGAKFMYHIWNGAGWGVNTEKWIDLSLYKDNGKFVRSAENGTVDIVSVLRPNNIDQLCPISWDDAEKIMSNEEPIVPEIEIPKEMTLTEIQNALGYKIKVVVE